MEICACTKLHQHHKFVSLFPRLSLSLFQRGEVLSCRVQPLCYYPPLSDSLSEKIFQTRVNGEKLCLGKNYILVINDTALADVFIQLPFFLPRIRILAHIKTFSFTSHYHVLVSQILPFFPSTENFLFFSLSQSLKKACNEKTNLLNNLSVSDCLSPRGEPQTN